MEGIEQQPKVTSAAVEEVFSIDCKRAEVFIQFIKSSDQNMIEGQVKKGHQKVIIPPGQTQLVKCNIWWSFPAARQVLFKPYFTVA